MQVQRGIEALNSFLGIIGAVIGQIHKVLIGVEWLGLGDDCRIEEW